MDVKNLEDVVPLLPMQEGLFVYAQTHQGVHDAYLIQAVFSFEGEFEVDRFCEAWKITCKRHIVARASMHHLRTPRPVMVIRKERDPEIVCIDMSPCTDIELDQKIETDLLEERQRGLDLAKDVLFKIRLYPCGERSARYAITTHHIIVDAWSLNLIESEFCEVYQALLEGRDYKLPVVPRYAAYISERIEQQKSGDRDYWESYCKGYQQIGGLPVTITCNETFDDRVFHEHRHDLSLMLSEKVRKAAQDLKTTPGVLFHAAWGLFLGSVLGVRDVMIGSVQSGRQHQALHLERVVGLLIQTLPLRLRWEKDTTFASLVEAVHRDMMSNQAIERSCIGEAYVPLCVHAFIMEDVPSMSEKPGQRSFTIEQRGAKTQAHFDLSPCIVSGDTYVLRLTHRVDRYDSTTIAWYAKSFCTQLSQLLDQPEIPFCELRTKAMMRPVSESESVSEVSTLVSRIIHNAEGWMDQPALRYHDVVLSYAELIERAREIASHILSHVSYDRDMRIGVCLKRSPDVIPSLLGVMLAGGAFVPLDPEYPKERLHYMIDDSACSCILVDDSTESSLDTAADIVLLNVSRGLRSNPEVVFPEIDEKDLAYVIYTSGSTGQPKGVMVEHRQISTTMETLATAFSFAPQDRCLQFASYSFDFSLAEMFAPLLKGASVVQIDKAIIDDPESFSRYLTALGVTKMKLPPSYLRVLDPDELPGVQQIVSAGEQLPVEVAMRWASRVELINEYGPTECTVGSTLHPVNADCVYRERVPIGKPIAAYEVFVLDEDGYEVIPGAVGELCIGGSGVARGYLNKATLTQEKFIPHPWKPDEKIYRTGDHVKRLPDDSIDFIGRKDKQVKFHGFRIELGAIESVLMSSVFVSHAIVQLQANKESSFLVAYCQWSKGEEAEQLREFLRQKLPIQMIPSHIVSVPSFPLTPNGKIDGKLLQDSYPCVPESRQQAVDYEIEALLITLFSKHCGAPCGLSDDFFLKGGKSLQAIALVGEIKSDLCAMISVSDLYEFPTPKMLASLIALKSNGKGSPGLSRKICFNEKGEVSIFCFPPPIGSGIAYQQLAACLPDVSFHSMHYWKSNDIIEEYAKHLIQEFENTSSRILMGYSGGGNIAFEVALNLEKKGYSLDGVICLDSWRKIKGKVPSLKHRKQQVADNLQWLRDNVVRRCSDESRTVASQRLMGELEEKVVSYLEFSESLWPSSRLNAAFCLIRAGLHQDIPALKDCRDQEWQHNINGKFLDFSGFGDHDVMLEQSYVHQNAELLHRVIMVLCGQTDTDQDVVVKPGMRL